MKITNREYVSIYDALGELMGLASAKQAIPDGGKVANQMHKAFRKMTKSYKAIIEERDGLVKDAREGFDTQPEKQQMFQDQLNLELKDLFDNETQEADLYKLAVRDAEIFAKYTTTPTTITMFDFLTAGSDYVSEAKTPDVKVEDATNPV